ncbi:SDR family NAD(P)-dependent oxidoreductase [Nocardioides sp. BP30]|uniref:SDR family NAD(P)-dependent oxidoreductase n=1 Tax=Nocardioides sp. BP30 TaxID=3036374 RepID=UPI0024695E79|nr:SDR family oxidoreductase [Nocardioides sp. BP30]WGL50700.1 SDR family NAD(P)-dependent oxidoreductase [Nocardioides sp. BP30]
MIDSERILLVTGASSGIGRATALAAASAGAHLVLAARDPDALQETADACECAGAASALAVPTDIGLDSDVEALVGAVLERHGRVDVAVHCAGVAAYGRTEQIPAEVFDGVIATNLTGSVNLARHVLPVLRRQRHGTLVLVGSVIGHLGVPTMSPYVLSKWGVRALARQLQLENRDVPGVSVRYVAPGGIDTPIYRLAANYAGFQGMPPPPVRRPDRVARQLLDRVDTRRGRDQLELTNELMRFGFTVFPRLYDALVGPLFAAAARDLGAPLAPGPGNVLAPHHVREGGDDGGRARRGLGVLAVLRNVGRLVRGPRGGQ